MTREEVIKNEHFPTEYEDNLNILLERINKLQSLHPTFKFIITSGFRSMETHLRIYKEKGITDKNKIPMKSKHLTCQAVDIADAKFFLTNWCKENEEVLKEIGLWCEDDVTVKRLHLQIVPPTSGKRWFKP